jgi:hypothetical protein
MLAKASEMALLTALEAACCTLPSTESLLLLLLLLLLLEEEKEEEGAALPAPAPAPAAAAERAASCCSLSLAKPLRSALSEASWARISLRRASEMTTGAC